MPPAISRPCTAGGLDAARNLPMDADRAPGSQPGPAEGRGLSLIVVGTTISARGSVSTHDTYVEARLYSPAESSLAVSPRPRYGHPFGFGNLALRCSELEQGKRKQGKLR